jgi:hypothetical protein
MRCKTLCHVCLPSDPLYHTHLHLPCLSCLSCKAIKAGRINKPIVAWCIGTCGSMFTSEVQFGHAGACANSDMETAVAKNKALKACGAIVPSR